MLSSLGLIRQPTWGHLKELHAAVKLCSETLLQGSQSNLSLGTTLQDVSLAMFPLLLIYFCSDAFHD